MNVCSSIKNCKNSVDNCTWRELLQNYQSLNFPLFKLIRKTNFNVDKFKKLKLRVRNSQCKSSVWKLSLKKFEKSNQVVHYKYNPFLYDFYTIT